MRPIFKMHGGKFYLSKFLIDLFPDDYYLLDYGEPFCGAASVLINKIPSKQEFINDIDPGIISIFRELQERPVEFITALKKLTYEGNTFLQVIGKCDPISEFILRRMSRGGLKKDFSWSDRLRGGKPGDVNAFETILELLPEIADRIKNVKIYNKPAMEVIEMYNREDVFLYLDPPYLPETRTSLNIYFQEMTKKNHFELFEVLKGFKGKVLISNYYSDVYRKLYKSWNCYKKIVVNNASQSKIKPFKIECAWTNY